MNERIRGLAKKAGFTVLRAQGLKESVPPNVFAGDGHILINTELSKFADLVAAEVCQVLSEEINRRDGYGYNKEALYQMIRKHFEVGQ